MMHSYAFPGDIDPKLMELGAQAATDTLDMLIAGDGHVEALPQEQLTEGNEPLKAAPKIFKETCRIDWTKTAKQVYDFVRGLSPVPGAWTTLKHMDGSEPQVVKIYHTTKVNDAADGESPGRLWVEKNKLYVATGEGVLSIDELQLAGKKRMLARDFINGFKNSGNTVLE